MFEHFTPRARHVIVLAHEHARELDHGWIGTEHLLLGLIDEGEGAAARVLRSYGLTGEGLKGQVELLVGRGDTPTPNHIPFSVNAKSALEQSLREAQAMDNGGIGTEHLLLGILSVPDGVAGQLLTAAKVVPAEARERLLKEIG